MCHSCPSLRRMERVSHGTPMRPGLILMLKVLFLVPAGASHSSTLPALLRGEVEKDRRVCEEFSQNQTMPLKGREFSSVEVIFSGLLMRINILIGFSLVVAKLQRIIDHNVWEMMFLHQAFFLCLYFQSGELTLMVISCFSVLRFSLNF